jgi:predicted RNA-binding Zn-ribbon protein involved in translation (DUF1610 family)
MSWLDHKYAGLMSSQLDLFKRRNTGYNFRCPECGDSQKNKFKARGYLLERDNKLHYYCHNCSFSASFRKFLERFNPTLYQEYLKETISDHVSPNARRVEEKKDISVITVPKFLKRNSPLKKLKKISQLQPDHPAKMLIESRKIPTTLHYQLFYCPDFAGWTDHIFPGLFTLPKKDKRVIIPFLDEEGNLFGYQGRAIDPKNSIRYLTIMIDQSKSKIFGLDRINREKKIYIFEGPFDSMFIPNSLAMAGSDISGAARSLNLDPDNVVIVYDNEPRNEEIIKRMLKAIEQGYSICVWPSSLEEKDVNDMILAGKRDADIKLMIDSNTFKGLEAKMALSVWSRVNAS